MSDDSSLLLMEQFHGPTCAFKDVALQFVGNMFEFFLTRKAAAKANPDSGIVCDPDTPDHITVVGATSGDTGSAAIEGLRGKANIECVCVFICLCGTLSLYCTSYASTIHVIRKVCVCTVGLVCALVGMNRGVSNRG